MSRAPKAKAKPAPPQRDHMAPWVADYSRVPWVSPTDRNTLQAYYDTGMTDWGRAVVRHYRPCERDREILQAVFASGEFLANADGSGSVTFKVADAARLANCSDHKEWLLHVLERLSQTHLTTWTAAGRKIGAFHIVAEVRRHEDGKKATAYFTPGFIYGWKVQRWVYLERLLHDLARVKSPRVRAIIQMFVTEENRWDMTLDNALKAVGAMDVNVVEQRARRREVREAAEDGSLARFGITLYTSGPGLEHLVLDRKVTDRYGLVQLDPADPTASFPGVDNDEEATPEQVSRTPHGALRTPHGQSEPLMGAGEPLMGVS